MPDTTILVGDVRERLRDLPDNSVHCVVTSPPYYGLRDYQTGTWEGGDPTCDHARYLGGHGAASKKQTSSAGTQKYAYVGKCGKCGATRTDRQIGLEPTLQDFIAGMVDVFREVRRVLRPDGVCWVNMGDSYANQGGAHGGRSDNQIGVGARRTHSAGGGDQSMRTPPPGFKPKDILMVPARLAIALCDDGWYLRQDIIWHKPNPMPESVTDRCTKSHEHIFMLAKSARYFYDADAVKEPFADKRNGASGAKSLPYSEGSGRRDTLGGEGKKGLGTAPESSGRNPRDVWTIATKPYPGRHFATFPPEIPERCIKASTSEKGVCPSCGAPWKREVERAKPPTVAPSELDRFGDGGARVHRKVGGQYQKWLDANPPKTVGWSPTCSCPPAEPVPATVLDPFGGAGTTALVARRLGRDAALIELNPAYVKMTEERLAPELGVFDLIRCV